MTEPVEIPMDSLSQSIRTDLLDSFVRTLDPEAPLHCARFYLSCITIFLEGWEALQPIRLSRPDFFTTALRFLTHARTHEELQQLDVRMSKCRCIRTGLVLEILHSVILEESPNLESLFNLIGNLLALCFTDVPLNTQFAPLPVDTSRKRAKKAHKAGRRLPWPEQSMDLFVHPPEQMMAMLWKIYHVYEAERVFSLLHVMTAASGTTFVSLLHTIPSFPQEFLYHLERAISAEGKLLSLATLLRYLGLVLTQSGYHDVIQFMMWLPHVHNMLITLTKALAFVSSQSTEDATEVEFLIVSLSNIGRYVTANYDFSPSLDLSQYAPEFVGPTPTATPTESSEFIPIAWWRVRDIAQSDTCHAPDCGETFSKQNRRFAACGGCDTVSYCSKSCQVAAWKHPYIPHKPLCRALKVYTQKFVGRNLNWRTVPCWDGPSIREVSRQVGVTEGEADALAGLLNRLLVISHYNKMIALPNSDKLVDLLG